MTGIIYDLGKYDISSAEFITLQTRTFSQEKLNQTE